MYISLSIAVLREKYEYKCTAVLKQKFPVASLKRWKNIHKPHSVTHVTLTCKINPVKKVVHNL